MYNLKLKQAAGRRDAFVTIETASDGTATDTGEVVPEWSILCSRWAEIAVSSGREFQQAMQTVPQLTAIVKLPYDSKTATITQRDRIRLKTRTINIAAVWNEKEANQQIVLWCVEEF